MVASRARSGKAGASPKVKVDGKHTGTAGNSHAGTTGHTVKPGDKLYLVTRADLAPGYQAVQSCHAMRQFTHDHPDVDSVWFTNSNYLALLSAPSEIELMRLLVSAHDADVPASAFREPDVGGKITAIALGPGERTRKLCEHLPLALKGSP